MAESKNKNDIVFNIGFTVDKSGLNDLTASLQRVRDAANLAVGELGFTEGNQALRETADNADRLREILTSNWNGTLGQLNLTGVNKAINDTWGSAKNLQDTMYQSGELGTRAYNDFASAVLGTNLQIQDSNKFLNQMATTMGNTVRWSIASNAMNKLVGAVESAWGFSKQLDSSLNDIRVVTSKSADDMAEFAESANAAAKALGTSTTDYTNAALIYYQQGLSDEEVAARTETTLKAANITGQSASAVSEELTAVWNGYQVATEEAESSIDILAAVAASTASDLEELSTAMSKVASSANAMGVTEEQLAAQISTIISATRQAPETVGQALKTIYARMTTIQSGMDEEGATLTSYTAKMANFGVDVLNATGQLRDMGEVIEEIGNEWDDFTREQQISLAQTMAGTRQYNNLLALFENWDKYEEALDVASNATGTLEEQESIYLESTVAHLQQLSTTAEETYSILFDTTSINHIIDGVTNLIGVLNTFLGSLGGGMSTLANLGVLGVRVFSQQIGGAIEKQITNLQIMKQNQQEMNIVMQQAELGMSATSKYAPLSTEAYREQAEIQMQLLDLSQQIGSEEYNRLTNLNAEHAQLKMLVSTWEEVSSTEGESNATIQKAIEEMVNRQQQVAQSYERSAQAAQKELDILRQISAGYGDELTKKQQEITVADVINNLDRNGLITQEQKNKLLAQQENTTKLINADQKTLNTLIQAEQEGLEYANSTRKVALQYIEDIAKYDGQDIDVLKAKIEGLYQVLMRGGYDKDGNFFTGLMQYEQQGVITSSIRSISSLAMSFTSLTNVIKTINNDDLNWWEKLSSILINLTMTVPMLIKSFSDFPKTITGMMSGITKLGTAVSNRSNQTRRGSTSAATSSTTIANEQETESAQAATAAVQKQREQEDLLTQALVRGAEAAEKKAAAQKQANLLTQQAVADEKLLSDQTFQTEQAITGLILAQADQEMSLSDLNIEDETTRNLLVELNQIMFEHTGTIREQGEALLDWAAKAEQANLITTEFGASIKAVGTSMIEDTSVFTAYTNAVAAQTERYEEGEIKLSTYTRYLRDFNLLMETSGVVSKEFTDKMRALTTALSKGEISTEEYNKGVKEAVAAETQEESTVDRLTKAFTINTKAQQEHKMAVEEDAGAQNRNTQSLNQEGVALNNNTSKTIKDTVQRWLHKNAIDAEAGAALTLKQAMQALTPIISMVTMATTAAIAIIRKIVQAYKENATAAEEAAASAERLADANDAVQESLENLQSSIDTYTSAKEALDECVEGTQEWKEALQDCNDAVIDLLNSVSNLDLTDINIGGLYDSSTGEINQDILQQIQDRVQTTANGTELASAFGNYQSTQASQVADLESELRSLIGPGVQNTVQDIYDNFDDLVEAMRSPTEDFGEVLTNTVARTTHLTDQQIESFEKWFNTWIEKGNQAEETLEAIAAIEVKEGLAGTDYEGDTTIQAMLENFETSLPNTIAQQLVEEYRDIQQARTDENGYIISLDNTALYNWEQEILDELNKAGYDYAEPRLKDFFNGNEFKVYDQEADEIIPLSIEEVADILAGQEGLAGLLEYAEQMNDHLTNLDENAPNGGNEAMRSYLESGNFDSATENQVNDLFTHFSPEQDIDVNISALEELFDITEDELNNLLVAFGAETAEELIQALFDSYEDYQTGVDSLTNGMREAAAEAFNGLEDQKDLTLTARQSIANMMEDALDYGSKSVLNATSAMLNNLSAEQQEIFAGVVDATDWGAVSVNQFVYALEDAGISVESVGANLYDFIVAMNATGDATNSTVDALANSISTLTGITSDLKAGDTISAEDYTSILSEMGSGMSSFFMETLDGEYKLVRSAEDFSNTVDDFILKSTNNALDNINNTIDQYQGLQKMMSGNAIETNAPDTSDLVSSIHGGNVEAVDWNDLAQSAYNYSNALELLSGQNEQLTGSQENLLVNQLALADSYYDLGNTIEVSRQQLGEWEDAFKDGTITAEQMDALAEFDASILETVDDTDAFNEKMQELYDQRDQISEMFAASCESLKELNAAYEEGIVTLEDYNRAAEGLYEAERLDGLDTDEIEDYAEHLQEIADESDDLAGNLTEDSKACKELATQITRMNKGVEDLNSNWEDWSDMLKNSTKESQEYADAMRDTRNAMADVLDVTADSLSEQYILDNMHDIELAAQGDADAIDRLRAAAYEQILVDIGIDDQALYEGMDYSLADIQSFLDENLLEVGAEIGDIEGSENYIDSLNALIDATDMTTTQVQNMLSDMGYNVEFEEETESVPASMPVTYTTHEITDLGYEKVPIKTPLETEGGTGYKITYQEVPVWTTRETAHTEYEEVEGEQTEFASQVETEGGFSGGGNITAHVANISKKASGSYNNLSSSNAGGNPSSSSSKSSGSSSSPKKSSGSSSGSGSDTVADPKVEDRIEDTADRYHDVNLRLKEISTSLSRLQSQENKLLGSALLDNLNEQLALLNSQIDATNEKMQIAQGELSEYRNKLAAYGVTFDSEGYISNYASVMQSQLNIVNSTIDKYNAMTAEGQEAYEDTLQDAKDAYQEFLDSISAYDTLLSETIPGLVDDIQDALDQEIQIQIQKFTMEIEIRLDMSEAERDWNEFYRKVILGIDDEDIFGNAVQDMADLLSYFNTGASDIFDLSGASVEEWLAQIEQGIAEGGSGSLSALTEQLNDTMAQIAQYNETGWSDVYGDNMSQAFEDLKNYTDEAMTQWETVVDLINDVKDAYLDIIDEAGDKIDDQTDQYEYINDLLEHDMNMIGLIYGDEAYDKMSTYYAQMRENNNQEIAWLRKVTDYYYEMMQAETDEDARKQWEEMWEDSLESLNSKVEDAVQNIIDEYTNTINQIFKELEEQITGGLGFDYMDEQWDLINQQADMYLDAINSAYAVEELRNKYLDAIDATDSIHAQEKLRDVMAEQLEYLENKENLSQYDVDRANMIYDLTLKQIALEESQQNKSTLRLRRDAQGNYSYQYVSDEEATRQAAEDLSAAYNDLYNFDKNAYQDNLDTIYSLAKECVEKLQDLALDTSLTDEERMEQMQYVYEEYCKMIENYANDNAVIRKNLEEDVMYCFNDLYGENVVNFENMTDEEIDNLMSELVPQWDSAVAEMAERFAGNDDDSFRSLCEDAFESVDEAAEDLEDRLEEVTETAGQSTDALISGYDEAVETVKELIDNNEDLLDELDDQISYVKECVNAVNELTTSYKQMYNAAMSAISAANQLWQEEQERDAAAAAADKSGSSSSSSSSSTASAAGSSSGSGNGVAEIGDKVLLTSGKYYSDSYGAGPSGSQYVGTGQYLYITNINTKGSHPYHLSDSNISPSSPANQHQIGWVKKDQLSGYDTGGYTGEWNNDDGKIALLHQKELVLNKADTENLLAAVNIVRDMGTMFDKLDNIINHKINALTEGLNKKHLSNFNNGQSLEQNVHIEATFPNVQNSHEVEDALNNIVNIASQYAHSTRAFQTASTSATSLIYNQG